MHIVVLSIQKHFYLSNSHSDGYIRENLGFSILPILLFETWGTQEYLGIDLTLYPQTICYPTTNQALTFSKIRQDQISFIKLLRNTLLAHLKEMIK